MLSHDWRIFDVGGARSLVRLEGFISGYLMNLSCLHLLAGYVDFPLIHR